MSKIIIRRAWHGNCSVLGCTNQHRSLHHLPDSQSQDGFGSWMQFVFDGNVPDNVAVGKRLLVCANHFVSDCFTNLEQYNAGLTKCLNLKDDAIPTVRGKTVDDGNATPQLRATRDVGFQTDPPGIQGDGTQLSLRTLQPHIKSQAVQTVSCNNVGFGTSTVPGAAPQPRLISQPMKRPRLDLEEEQDPFEGSSSMVSSQGLDANYDPADSVTALTESTDMSCAASPQNHDSANETSHGHPPLVKKDIPDLDPHNVVVNIACLLQLFQQCRQCSAECVVRKQDDKTHFTVIQHCQICNLVTTWTSQPFNESEESVVLPCEVREGDQEAAASMMMMGQTDREPSRKTSRLIEDEKKRKDQKSENKLDPFAEVEVTIVESTEESGTEEEEEEEQEDEGEIDDKSEDEMDDESEKEESEMEESEKEESEKEMDVDEESKEKMEKTTKGRRMTSACANCNVVFKEYKNGYNRRSVLSLTSLATCKMVFPGFSPNVNSFLCRKCFAAMEKTTVKNGEIITLYTPPPSRSTKTPKRPKRGGAGPRAKAISYLNHSSYFSAIRTLLQIDAAKKDLLKGISYTIQKERRKLVADKSGPFRSRVECNVLSQFSWKSCLDWAEERAPITLSCLKAMFPQPKNITHQHWVTEDGNRRPMTDTEAQALLDKRAGMVLSIILYTSCLNRLNFVQTCLGVIMWRHSCSPKMFKFMNSLGISQSPDSAVGHVDRLRTGHNEQVKLWKAAVETVPTAQKKQRIENSYSLTWDNVELTTRAKRQASRHGDTILLWALTFAHKNKVNFGHLHGPGQKAVDVPLHRVLPTPEDYNSLRERMVVLVTRVLSENLTALHGTKKKVVMHIPHMYTDKMEEKSTVVSLGVMPSNASTTEGVLEMMDSLKTFVPSVNGETYPILCCGEGLSVECRFEGLVETPQEFQKDTILLQDTVDLLFTQSSANSRGTLAQIKAFFPHRSLKNDVKDNVPHVWDFIEFVTCAYITLCATTMCGINQVDQTPEGFPDKADQQMGWLNNLAQQLVDSVWMPPSREDIKTAAATKSADAQENPQIFPFCSCEQDKAEEMVLCCSNQCGSRRFHISCVNLDAAPVEDWFCSAACQEDDTYVYCFCHKRLGGTMVQCHLKDQCRRHEWYHLDCLSPAAQLESQDTWYCSTDCLYGAEGEDHVQNYSKAVIWEGLCHMARRDAVREGDGRAMTASWKMDLISFWTRKHPKYFIIAHQMLTGIEGNLPERLRNDMIWNRVANLQGKPGGNVGLDSVNEFLNRELKDMLKRPRGMYTDKQISQCAEHSGSFGREVDRMFTEAAMGNFISPNMQLSTRGKKHGEDIAMFVKEFQGDGLFEYLPGRAHKGFKEFTYQQKISDPQKMALQMMHLAEQMDDWRDLRDAS